ncbi:MAG: shikimate dehydrogenase [Deltaproteobacteria bacterium]|nr:MAG: shikimate dehydrogenase [Deltaproteobacteria bacterium]
MSCYIIAEAGSNHCGNRDVAHRLVDVAADAGADAVKFQLFKAEELYPRSAGASDYLGDPRSIYDIIRDLEMPASWLEPLARHCADRGIDFLVSAFDEQSVDAVDPFVASHKIASYEMTHHPLVRHVAAKGKRVLLSTGTASLDEVGAAVDVVRGAGNDDLVLLQCTASYPTPLDQANVRAVRTLADAFGVPAGLSDHTRDPITAPAAAVALGAVVVEKHVTLDNKLPGPDHAFAVEPAELAAMVRAIRATERVLGDGRKVPLPVERELRAFARRTIMTRRPIRAGEVLDRSNVAVLRCGKRQPGLPPAALPAILGRRAARDLPAETGLTDADIAD